MVVNVHAHEIHEGGDCMTYQITIGGKPVFTGLSQTAAKSRCALLLAMSSRLDIFYEKEVSI